MIRINQMKLKPEEPESLIQKKIVEMLKIKENQLISWKIVKKSIDARKNQVFYVYTVDVALEPHLYKLKAIRSKYSIVEDSLPKKIYNPYVGHRPIIIGSGPSGLFCGLLLSLHGAKPIIIERGKKVEERIKDVDLFWNQGLLNPESNVQFGEGGAGTFSDGKLNTLIRDKEGRSRWVLQEMVKAGAPEEILIWSKPHIGTDRLRRVVINIRKAIENKGGTFLFEEKMTDIEKLNNQGVVVKTNKGQHISQTVIIAVGHSARDTVEMLGRHITLTQKPFAIGLRIEHPRQMIDEWQYGIQSKKNLLPAADYKLVHHCRNGRTVYTFCMCPGGVVTASSSEIGTVVTNGMSYYARDQENSNSAVLVNINPEDFGGSHVTAGFDFQRKLERKAFELGGGGYFAPIQCFGDFKERVLTTQVGNIKPSYQPGTTLSNLTTLLPDYVTEALLEGIDQFGRKINGFNREDAILSGVETRSSSPVRMVRDERMMSSLEGVHVIGEGAGYAGGIMSAAMDGMKVAEMILEGIN